jgi:dGTPase
MPAESVLARLRFPVERSRGRRYPEQAHPYRNEFRRDRDRIVHARAFRRLENKTQVFTPGLSDHFRNRLTHTIEVSQIARTVASLLGLSEDLTEALALAHDIGHPPFGHAGEGELDSMMRRFGERFEHNRHALRIVESFENPYPRFPGLNLTFEVREGIVKHSRDFEPGEIPDLDDGYHAGLVDMAEARAAVEQFAELYEITEYQFPGVSERVRLKEIVRGLIDGLVSGLMEGTAAACEGLPDVDAVRAHSGRAARFTAEAAKTSAQLKTYLRQSVYESPALVRARSDSVALIAGLFEFLLRHPEKMPAVYLEESAGQPLHRQVCDYIAGMTDGYFVRTCEQLGIS